MYIQRTLETSVKSASDDFYVVLLTGSRQVGKTTLLENLSKKNRSYVSLDDMDRRLAAKKDPIGFIESLKLPVLIDEIQYAPELFPAIKMIVDEKKRPGLFWITGSQQFSMMKNVSESLAGRVAILNLYGISLAEEQSRPKTSFFIPTVKELEKRQNKMKLLSTDQIFNKIWRGSYPHLVTRKGKNWQRFYESYLTTYIERDVRELLKIDDLMSFRRFIQIAAGRTGQLLNYLDISKEVGVSLPTIKSWFAVLEATGLIVFIQPYFRNFNKRLIKTPKFYFMDTGLCCFLTRWNNAEVLQHGAMSGAMLETYVVSEIIKSYTNNGYAPPLYFYRDKDKREVDLLIEQAGKLHPVEIKKTSSIHSSGFKGFEFLKNLKTPIGHGAVLCFQKKLIPFDSQTSISSVSLV